MQQNKRYRLCDVEEAIAEMEELSEVADDIAETDEDMQLVISGWQVHIPDLNLYLKEGIMCYWDKEEKMYMPDFSVTVVYERDISKEDSRIEDSVVKKSDASDFLYYEQDGFVITLANWLNGRLPIEQIEQLWCEIEIPKTEDSSQK